MIRFRFPIPYCDVCAWILLIINGEVFIWLPLSEQGEKTGKGKGNLKPAQALWERTCEELSSIRTRAYCPFMGQEKKKEERKKEKWSCPTWGLQSVLGVAKKVGVWWAEGYQNSDQVLWSVFTPSQHVREVRIQKNKLEPSYFHSEDYHYLTKIKELFKMVWP